MRISYCLLYKKTKLSLGLKILFIPTTLGIQEVGKYQVCHTVVM